MEKQEESQQQIVSILAFTASPSRDAGRGEIEQERSVAFKQPYRNPEAADGETNTLVLPCPSIWGMKRQREKLEAFLARAFSYGAVDVSRDCIRHNARTPRKILHCQIDAAMRSSACGVHLRIWSLEHRQVCARAKARGTTSSALALRFYTCYRLVYTLMRDC